MATTTRTLSAEVRRALMNRLPPNRLGERIRELREARGLTQADVAARAGCGRAYIAALELGRVQYPDRERYYALAQALGTSTWDLLQAAGYIEDIDILAGIDPQLLAAARGAPRDVQRSAAHMLNAAKRSDGNE